MLYRISFLTGSTILFIHPIVILIIRVRWKMEEKMNFLSVWELESGAKWVVIGSKDRKSGCNKVKSFLALSYAFIQRYLLLVGEVLTILGSAICTVYNSIVYSLCNKFTWPKFNKAFFILTLSPTLISCFGLEKEGASLESQLYVPYSLLLVDFSLKVYCI